MIDLHSHVLPGLDDGATTLEESLELCAAVAADGVEVLAATPHVRAVDYPTTPEQMEAALAELLAAGPPVTVIAGGELDVGELDRPVDELMRFCLGGTRALLVETPYVGWPLDLADRLFRLRVQGFQPILAHPERNFDVQERPELLEPLMGANVLIQVTAASIDGRLGGRASRASRRLLDLGLMHLVASDAHTPDVRAAGLSGAVRALGDDRLANWLTFEVPAAVLAGADIPPRPARQRRRFFR